MIFKRKSIIMSLLLVFTLQFIIPAPTFGSDTAFNAKNAYGYIEYLAEAIGPRPPGSAQEYLAGEYIAEKFIRAGWEVTKQNFSSVKEVEQGSLKKYSLTESRNIIAKKPGGNKEKQIIIGAHYDTADFNTPGAADNASGIGILLETANVVGDKYPDYEIIMIAFGAEESGLTGSRYFVENYDISKVVLMLNLDMISDGNTIALDGGGRRSTPAALLIETYKLARKIGLDPEVHRDLMVLARDSQDGGSSDFSPFLDKGIPALGIGQGGEHPAHYHQPTDTMKHINKLTLERTGNLLLELMDNLPKKLPALRGGWDSSYLTLDFGLFLQTIESKQLKLFVIICLLIAAFCLFYKRSQSWFALFWIIPGYWVLNVISVAMGMLTTGVIGLIKGYQEPWYAHPLFFLIYIISVSTVYAYFITQFLARLPQKIFPPKADIFWSGSILMLGAFTLAAGSTRWDLAFYPAVWLLSVILSRYGNRFALVIIGPLMIYSLHWELLNSQLWSEILRTMQEHAIISAVIYGLVIVPLMLSIQAARLRYDGKWPQLTPQVSLAVIIYLTFFTALVPAYTENKPQLITLRQEWKDNNLKLTAIAKDYLPYKLTEISGLQRISGVSGGTQIKKGLQPINCVINPKSLTMGQERLVTVSVKFDYSVQPAGYKLILRSDKSFSLVNAGEFFPTGKISGLLKVDGEAPSGTYGIILERTQNAVKEFQLFIKAQGNVAITLEAFYPKKFANISYSMPNTIIRYENIVTFTKEI